MKVRKLLFVFVFLIMMIGVGSMGVKAAGSNEAFMISTGPGADASNSMTITWHSEISGTFLLYVKKDVDPNFTDPMVAMPESVAIEHFDTKTNINHQVNKCVVRLENLDSGTDYIYKVGKSTFSSVKSFKTASNTESFSFLYMADYHVYNPVATRLQKAESIYSEAKKVDDIAFTLHGGDVVAYGSSYDYWESLMDSSFANEGMMAMTPGNHDFYNGSAQTVGVGYFNNILTNPDNGADTVKNSSYYFRYNNVLFVSIDNESSTQSYAKLASQQAWFRQVMEENPSQYIITYNHRPFYNGSTGNSGHANTNRTNWSSMFDEFGVDLVLSGHDHVFVRTKKTYNGQVSENENLGTVYITAPQIGDRPSEANPNNPYTNFDALIGGNYSGGVIITVNPNNFQTKLINDNGEILDTSTNSAKRDPINYSEANKQAVVDNITATYNHEDNLATVAFNNSDYLYVDFVRVFKQSTFLINKKIGIDSKDVVLSNLLVNTKDDYTVQVNFNDGTVLNREISIKTAPPFGTVTNVEAISEEGTNILYYTSGFKNKQVAKVKIYLDGVLNVESLISDGYGTKGFALSNVEKGHEYDVTLDIIDRFDDVVFTETVKLLDPLILLEDYDVSVSEDLFIGDTGKVSIVAIPADAFNQAYTYVSSNPFIFIVNELGDYEALGSGEVTLTVKEETSGIEKSINIIINKKAYGFLGELSVSKTESYILDVPHNFINNQIKQLNIYLNEVLLGNVDVSDGEQTSSVDLGKLLPGKEYQIKVDAIDIFDDMAASKELAYTDPAILVTDLEVTYDEKMVVGDNQTLAVIVKPVNASFKEVQYLSQNSDIVSVTSLGELTAIKAGVATIVISVKNSEFTKSIIITVSEKVTSIKVTAPAEIKLGTKIDAFVQVEITPNVEAEVTYSSSDEELLTIDETGKMTPKKAGEVTVTVTVDDISETVTVKVLKKSGCGNGAMVLALLPMSFALIFFRRRTI